MDGKHKPLWGGSQETSGLSSLTENEQADVVVVGGGITGLTAARLLVEAGRRVVLLEQERVGSGTTGGTTAHVTQVPDRRFKEIDSKFGHDGVRQLVASSRAALEQIATWAEAAGIDCDFQRVPAFLYTESSDEVEELEKEARTAREAGMDAELVRDVRDIPLPFRVAAAVRFAEQARFHPTAYLSGLERRFLESGGKIYEKTRVVEVHGGDQGKPCRVVTEKGFVVTAEAVLFATHTPAGFTLLHTELEAYRSYVMAVRLRGGQTPPDGLFFDTADPYNYTRLQPTERGNLLIVGGKDHPTGREQDTEASYHALESYIRERWDVESIEYRWSAQFYEPPDGLPLIGQSLTGGRVYVATGYSGTGMMFGTLGGMLLADLVLDRPNPWADLYRSTRFKPLASGPHLAKLNLSVAKHFIQDRVEIPRVDDLSAVPLGEGRVVQIDGEKVAVYRGEDGTLRTISPVCTHAGCIVQWNKGEKTWDCPCHGGRYTPEGQVIEGPPVKGLAPVQLHAKAGK